LPKFDPAVLVPGQHVRAVIGLDGGSTSVKAVLVDHETGEVLYKAYTLSKGNPIQDTKDLLARLLANAVQHQGATLEVMGFGATGYAAKVLDESVRADVNIVETVAHMMAAVRWVPDADVVCDIGGQDIKVLFLREAKRRPRREGLPAQQPVLSGQRHVAAGDGRSVRRPAPGVRRDRVQAEPWRPSSATAARCSSTPTG
jgi:hypothetical protein